jgi:cysteinyl-tRNA synthetase
MIRLFNSLTKSKETFSPLEKEVRIYSCGPTVYDFVHIGNLRAFILSDILRRVFEFNAFSVKQVMNITDIGQLTSDSDTGEDKMTKAIRREGKGLSLASMKEIADTYTEAFLKDIQVLNIEMPHVLPKASDHIEEQITMIQVLEKKGHTYNTNDGVYLDTTTISDYGKLGGLSDEHQSRIGENSEKRNPSDFALWKFNNEIGFSSPWGQGSPGWHIECSSMSQKYLGEQFDIHTGGADLIAIHHNNEIAQSEGANGKIPAHFWLHNAFVNVAGGKMAKSEGTGITMRNIVDKSFSPLSYRYWLLTGHYRSQVNFTWEALEAAQNALDKLYVFVQTLGEKSDSPLDGYIKRFTDSINDDLGTPQAIAIMWELIKDSDAEDADKLATLLKFDEVLGLKLSDIKPVEIPQKVRELIAQREETRIKGDWEESDRLRELIKKAGFVVSDTDDGQVITESR